MAISPSGSLIDIYNNPQSFQFQSKNLKYDKDIRGGGYSGQPFIKRVAPDDIDNLNSLTTIALSLDYPIRGGSYEELAAREDFARIDRFLLSHPGGTAFLDKQAGLMLSNPRIPMAQSGGVFANQAYSDGRNLMTQVADAGTGIRTPNAGIDGLVLERFENKYEYVTAITPTQENRLILLKDLKLSQPPQTTISSINQIGTIVNSLEDTVSSLVNNAPAISPTISSTQRNAATRLGINTVTPGELFNYPGGPGSLYGIISNTLILKATNSRNAFIDTSNAQRWIGNFGDEDIRTSVTKNVFGEDVQGRPLVDLQFVKHLGLSRVYNSFDGSFFNDENPGANADDQSATLAQQSGDGFIRADKESNTPNTENYFKFTMGYQGLLSARQTTTRNANTLYPDFRENVLDPDTVISRDYTNKLINKITRVGIGNPGVNPLSAGNEKAGRDLVNMTDNQPSEGHDFSGDNRDLIKFAFETLKNNSETNQSVFTHFRAFLTGYSDSHNAEWSPKRYAGRGENFYTYQGANRNVSFNFKIAAQSKAEMKFLYRKLNYLTSTLYPDYTDKGSMRGNITKLTIGNLFYRSPGILNSLNLTVADEYPWEIAMDAPENGDDKDMLELPQIIDVAVSFTPILDVLPQTSLDIDDANNTQTPILVMPSDDDARYNAFMNR